MPSTTGRTFCQTPEIDPLTKYSMVALRCGLLRSQGRHRHLPDTNMGRLALSFQFSDPAFVRLGTMALPDFLAHRCRPRSCVVHERPGYCDDVGDVVPGSNLLRSVNFHSAPDRGLGVSVRVHAVTVGGAAGRSRVIGTGFSWSRASRWRSRMERGADLDRERVAVLGRG